MISCKYECLGEVMVIIDPIFARMHMGFDDFNVYFLASKVSTLCQL